MKILNLAQFIAIQHDVVFSDYRPCVFGPLMIKRGSCGNNDFFESGVVDAIDSNSSFDSIELLDEAEKNGLSLAMDFSVIGRNGLYPEPEQLYAVWEKTDLQEFVEELQKIMEDMP